MLKRRVTSFHMGIIQVFVVLILLVGVSFSFIFYDGSNQAVSQLATQITQTLSAKVREKTETFLGTPAAQITSLGRTLEASQLLQNREAIWKALWEELKVLPYVDSIYIGDEDGGFLQSRRYPRYATRLVSQADNEIPDLHLTPEQIQQSQSEQLPPSEDSSLASEDSSSAEDLAKQTWWYRDEEYQVLETHTEATDYDPRDHPWYEDIFDLHRIQWTDVYIFQTAKVPGLTASFPMLTPEGELAGVIGVDIPLRKLSEFFSEQYISQNGRTFLINGNGEVLAFSEDLPLVKEDPANGELSPLQLKDLPYSWIEQAYQQHIDLKQPTLIAEVQGQHYYSVFQPLSGQFPLGWMVGVVIPENDLLGPINETLEKALLLTLVILVGSLFVVYWLGRRLSRPIMQLAKETENIKDLQFEQVHRVDSGFQEVQVLSESLFSAAKGLQSFKKYVPADVVRQLVLTGDEAKLGGKKEELTILFTDIAGFTTLSETMEPDALMLHLSDYLDQLSQVIMKERGTIDKYIGDAIMAFWGAPVALPNTPALACQAALQCQRILPTLNKTWRQEGKPMLQTRIGIHTGEVIVGNVGSESRLNYTIIGDSVNLASRLESANRIYKTSILISEQTYLAVRDDFHCRFLDIITVKGKRTGVKVYELVAQSKDLVSTSFLNLQTQYEHAFEHYLEQKWQEAQTLLQALIKQYPHEPVVEMLMQRCQHFEAHPEQVPENWDGSHVLQEK